MSLLSLHPVPTLLQRTRAELSAAFSPGQARVGRSPVCLDVMGGIAGETGSICASLPLERIAASVVAQPRVDGLLQVFSFDELDAHRPFTLCMPMRSLMETRPEALVSELSEPGRRWAWPVIGAIRQLQLHGQTGLNVALLNTIPLQMVEQRDLALAAASVMALSESEDPDAVRAVQLSMLNHASTPGQAAAATRVSGGTINRWASDVQQPLLPIAVPTGMRWVAIDVNAEREDAREAIAHARIAARMAHGLILKKMRDIGTAAGRTLVTDPMGGLLGRLDSNDYKRWFRPYLPEMLRGADFLDSMDEVSPPDLKIDADVEYAVRGIADHHVLEALRVRNFCRFVEEANRLQPDDPNRGVLLDKAGHLMYASHQSLSGDARLSIDQADVLVRLVRQRERSGLYGARLTGTGCGGMVSVLCEDNDRATTGLADVLMAYSEQTTLAAASYRTASEPMKVAGSAVAEIGTR